MTALDGRRVDFGRTKLQSLDKSLSEALHKWNNDVITEISLQQSIIRFKVNWISKRENALF